VAQIFGIDLGTTYSCIAVVDEHGLEAVIPNTENELTTPSVVYFEESGDVIVGQAAKELNKVSPHRVVEAVKRQMGDPNWCFEIDGKSYTPQDISARILRKVVADAELVMGCEIKDVVITCPAYFGVRELEATRQAGELAGLTVHNIISEPTAAAFAYTEGEAVDECLLVYDLGGGTFDVTVIDASSRKVLAVDGNKELGGKDWDSAIVAYWLAEFEAQTGIPGSDLQADLDVYQGLVNDAEAAKKRLSTTDKHQIRIRFGAESALIELTRQQFEEITAARLESTIQRTRAVMEKAAQKGGRAIDSILLVGGSTFMPQVEARLTAEFGLPIKRKNPNQIVALGAALRGQKAALDNAFESMFPDWSSDADEGSASMSDAEREKATRAVADQLGVDPVKAGRLLGGEMVDVTSKSFGLGVVDNDDNDYVDNVILRNDDVPTKVTQSYTTRGETEFLTLKMFENLVESRGRVELGDCDLLGEARMSFPRRVPANHRVEVTFRLSSDRLLQLLAVDPVTGVEFTADFHAKGLLTAEEMTDARRHIDSIKVS
jgi:molecular chaperone DnaK